MENLIAGPCSVESKEQFNSTLRELLKIGVTNIRAGAWKPRTNHGEFEGLGVDALKIIKEAKDEGYKFTSFVEVANDLQVMYAQKYEIDVFWVGARTTGNPFSVQEIADAIRDKEKTILVKNPMQNDIKLWIGAINRFRAEGFKNVYPIFRGFSQEGVYRNQPEWEVLEELKSKLGFENSEIIIDASHIAGDRKYIKEIVNKAKSLGYQSFMLESHINPLEALTDAAQQVEPKELVSFLHSKETLDYERNIINGIDNEIINLLNKRFEASDQIGRKKKKENTLVFDPLRYADVRLKYGKFANIYEAIHNESTKKQKKL